MRQESEETDIVQEKVHTYQTQQNVFAIGFSTRADQPFRLALCTFSEDVKNLYEIIQLSPTTNMFERRASFYHEYPANKVIWYPCQDNAAPDILATSGENIKVWRVIENGECELQTTLIPNSKLSAPLTSFDWNTNLPNLMVTSSIDASCAVWDVCKEDLIKQMIVGTDQVYDISFSSDREIFAQVSGDGILRQFDIRDSRANVLYRTADGNPLVKLAWNKKDRNYIGLIEMDKKSITLVDCRRHGTVSKLEHHRDFVNAICWAPHTSTHICSVGDDKQALIWDLTNSQEVHYSPLLEYTSEQPISNLCWSLLQNDWLSICYSEYLQILKV